MIYIDFFLIPIWVIITKTFYIKLNDILYFNTKVIKLILQFITKDLSNLYIESVVYQIILKTEISQSLFIILSKCILFLYFKIIYMKTVKQKLLMQMFNF